jgi:NADH-quinone oxidoreductase subunit C
VQETSTKLLENKLPILLERFASEVTSATDFRGDLIVDVKPEKIRDILEALKTCPATPFNMMIDLFGMDYLKVDPPAPERFAVIYNLYSMTVKRRVHVKVWLSEDKPEIESIHDIYKAANWFEREAFDLFGIKFIGHPNLQRILCHSDFVGHPLRKDYPSDGYQRLKSALPTNEL